LCNFVGYFRKIRGLLKTCLSISGYSGFGATKGFFFVALSASAHDGKTTLSLDSGSNGIGTFETQQTEQGLR